MEKKKPKVFDANIEQLMQLALVEPSNDSNIVGLGAMWLAAELFCLQEQQETEQSEVVEQNESL
jgi:hypothetical protein